MIGSIPRRAILGRQSPLSIETVAFCALLVLLVLAYVACLWDQLHYGLEYDESYLLNVADNISSGKGFIDDGVSFWTTGTPFDPNISTGPVLLLPTALLWAISDHSLTITRFVPIFFFLLYSAAIATLFYRWRGRWAALTALVGPLLLPILHPDLANRSLMPGRFIGEIAATALLVLSALALARNRSLLAGLLGGLSIQAKLNFALPVAVMFATMCLGLWICHQRIPLRWVARFALGAVIPTLVFEAYKLVFLGIQGYTSNLALSIAFSRSQSASLTDTPLNAFIKFSLLPQLVTGPAVAVLLALLVVLSGFYLLQSRLSSSVPSPAMAPASARRTLPLLSVLTAGLAILAWWSLSSTQMSPRPAIPAFLIALPLVSSLFMLVSIDLRTQSRGRIRGLTSLIPCAAFALLCLTVVYQGVRILHNDSGQALLANQQGAAAAIQRASGELPIDDFWTNPEFTVLTDLTFQDNRLTAPSLLVFTSVRALAEFGSPNATLFDAACGDTVFISTDVLVCYPLAR